MDCRGVRRATVPGLYRWGFLTPPVAGADLRAALVASCFRGAFPPVDLRAVCLVRAIVINLPRPGTRLSEAAVTDLIPAELLQYVCLLGMRL